MSTVDFSSSNRTTFSITPLRDDGSNFADYEPKVKVLCGAKGILKFLEGRARKPKELHVANGVFMKPGTIDKPATEEEIENAETKMDTYEQNEAMCKHILMSSVSPRLCSKIKSLATPNSMWVAICTDVKNKSTLQKMDVRRLLEAMKLTENSDAAAHVSEMEAHFRLMQERVDELATIGDPVNARTHFQIALKSIPESYHATVQTIDTADTLNGEKTTAEEVITIFLREARHRVILKAETKAGEALAAYANSNSKSKGGDSGKAKKRKPKCFNCNKLGHKSKDCFAPGGGKEGQGPHQMNQKSQRGGKPENSTSSANVASHSEATKEGGTMFAFSATSSFHCIAAKLGIPAEHHSAILNSSASHHYYPDNSKFKNLEPISDPIKLTDGHTLPALGIGNVEITLPNGDKQNKVML